MTPSLDSLLLYTHSGNGIAQSVPLHPGTTGNGMCRGMILEVHGIRLKICRVFIQSESNVFSVTKEQLFAKFFPSRGCIGWQYHPIPVLNLDSMTPKELLVRLVDFSPFLVRPYEQAGGGGVKIREYGDQ
jgi:hypothetical protein